MRFYLETQHQLFGNKLLLFLIAKFSQYLNLIKNLPILIIHSLIRKKPLTSYQYFGLQQTQFKNIILIIMIPLYNEKVQMNQSYRKQIQIGLLRIIPGEVIKKCCINKILRLAITVLKLNLLQSSLLNYLLQKVDFSLHIHGNQNQQQLDEKIFEIIVLHGYYAKHFQQKKLYQIQQNILHYIPQFYEKYQNFQPQINLKNLTHNQINTIYQNWIIYLDSQKPPPNNHIFLSANLETNTQTIHGSIKKKKNILNNNKVYNWSNKHQADDQLSEISQQNSYKVTEITQNMQQSNQIKFLDFK